MCPPPAPRPWRGARPPAHWPVALTLLVAAALGSTRSAAALPSPAPPTATPAEHDLRAAALAARLRDQNGRPGGFEPTGGQPTAVFVVSASRLKRLRDWEAGLRRRFEGLRFVRVADVPPARPPARYEEVAGRLRQHVPREVSVRVDLDRLWATGFGLDSQQVNLLVFDAAGRLAGQLAGSPTPERLARAVALVEPLAPAPAPGDPR